MYAAPRATTGVFTPHSASPLRPPVLNHGSLEHAILIPTTLRYHVTELHQRFVSQLPPPTDEFALEEGKSPVPSFFPGFCPSWRGRLRKGRMTHQEPTRTFHILTEFEAHAQRGNAVHALAAQLPRAKMPDAVGPQYGARHAAH